MRAARLMAEITQQSLAQSVGVSTQSVRDWERRGASPNQKRIKAIADKLKVTVGWLITGEGDSDAA